ncbi:MAG: hypothetical protein K2Y29_04680 [Beijerinckiaceae bacterium]|nr:hypothetical protein [Beijerinckiaceae bacterium]
MQPLPRDSVIVLELLLAREPVELAEPVAVLLEEPGVLPVTPDELPLDPSELLVDGELLLLEGELLLDDPVALRPLVLATPLPLVASAEIMTVMPGRSVIERMSAAALEEPEDDEPAPEEPVPERPLLVLVPEPEPVVELEPVLELPLAAPSPLAVELVMTMWQGALALALLLELGLLLVEPDWAMARPAAMDTESAPNAIELKRCLMVISC